VSATEVTKLRNDVAAANGDENPKGDRFNFNDEQHQARIDEENKQRASQEVNRQQFQSDLRA
jgi:hypothetical protein